ncbi:MAG: serine/threonine-protein kinase [Polyangiaceae bacterium]
MPFEPVAQSAAGEGLGTSADLREQDRTSTETTTVSAKSLVGQVLGGTYRILELLDEGGMGRLYRAEHVRLRRPIAVKVLANHLAHDVGALARFNREAEIVSQLHHPHIVHILDFDQTDRGAPYIVMELLEGESLARRLDRDCMLAIADVIQIVTQISGALQLAHQKGIRSSRPQARQRSPDCHRRRAGLHQVARLRYQQESLCIIESHT